MPDPTPALTAEELIAWVDTTTRHWQQLIAAHPEILAIPCDVRETTSVAGLLQHIVAAELRYAQRLNSIPQTPYEEIPIHPAEAIFAIHGQAIALFQTVVAEPGYDWEETISFQTRSLGTLAATRRTILVHALMHSIRHYAQLATLVRHHGIQPNWQMDYLSMGARPA
jgi:uncharacterized damage-inducible protein DinB